MPRVHTKTKSKAGKTYACDRCRADILPGTKYYVWSFRYGGPRFQHEACGYPQRSQLTQSKLSAVYGAIEGFNPSGAESADEIAGMMTGVAEVAREVAEEYREAVSAMNMEGSGNENEERADALETFADDLESEAGDIEGEEWEAEEVEEGEEAPAVPVNQDGDTFEEWLEALRDRANEAVGGLDL